MQREPVWHVIFRDLIALGVLCLAALLYWSISLQEKQLRNLGSAVAQMREDIVGLQRPVACGDRAFPGVPLSTRPHMDATYPNLLTDDPFYQTTLPTLLPADFRPKGTRKLATVAKPDNLHPFSNWSQVSGWVSQCSVGVARNHFGKFETLAPDMAIKMEERPIAGAEGTEFWIHLRDNVYWAPLTAAMLSNRVQLAPHFQEKHQVTAHDFKFYYDAVMNPWVQSAGAVAERNYLADIDEVRVIDPLTFVVRWKTAEVTDSEGKTSRRMKYAAKWVTSGFRPLATWVYQYFADGTKIVEDDSASDTYRTNSSWAQNFNQHWAKNCIVSCGPWIFEQMSDQQISFRRNPDHYEPLEVLVNSMEVYFKESVDGIWEDFKAGKLDTCELRPEQLVEWESFQKSAQYAKQRDAGNSIDRVDYVARTYAYIGWNSVKPFFGSARTRRAMTQAIDRQRIIDRNLNGLGILIHGPFFYLSKANNPLITPWPFDPFAAREQLESEGWTDRRGTGVMENTVDGKVKPFEFSLTYFVRNPTSQAIGQYIVLAMKEIGVKCTLNGVDMADLSAVFDDKSFDAVLLAWGLGSPPEDPRQLWSSAGAKEKGSSNAVGFANAEIDRIIDALDFTFDPKKRMELFHRFDAIIHEEAPYTFLYTPKSVLLHRSYLKNVWIPSERQDLIPGADVAEPQSSIFWLSGGNEFTR